MNPYAKYIEGKDPLTVVAATPERIRQIVTQLGDGGMERAYAPGKWTVKQILAHLAQCEMMFGSRFRQALTIDEYMIQLFDQDEWMNVEPFGDGATELAAFCAMRDWNVNLWRSLDATAWQRRLVHPERGEMTLRVLLEMMGGHDLNHLEQLESMVK